MKITNTEQQDPLVHLMDAMRLGGSESIEASERRGGQEMLEATVLPVDGSERPDVQALGIQFGEPVADDPLFRDATLPAGWSKSPGDNPYGYWTYIVDERGENRAAVFYKAAFYDRRATISAIRQCFCSHSRDSHPYVDGLYPGPYPCGKCGCDGSPLMERQP